MKIEKELFKLYLMKEKLLKKIENQNILIKKELKNIKNKYKKLQEKFKKLNKKQNKK
jgi:transcriptional regulatory protein LevR